MNPFYSSPKNAIEVDNLCHKYGSFLAVDHISFEVKSGTTFGLIGPNGAGKSTTIKMLTTLLPITSGKGKVNGYDLAKDPVKVRASIGYVPQLISADGDLTAYENLLISSKLYGVKKEEREEKIQTILEFLALTDHQNKLTNTFSGGQIRRLEIAQALLHEPAILFLDEPAVGLDPAARKSLWKTIQQVRVKKGLTILMTTHDMEEADKLCDIVALMHQGRIVVMDTPQNLKASLGPKATLDDVFVLHTGNSLNEGGNYQNVRETRGTISHL